MEENLDTDMAKLKQESASKIEEITAKLSKELESIAENIEQIDKLRMESIDDLENKKKELRESSSSRSICLGPEDIREKIAITEKDIELRKDSITKLDETIAKLDEEIARIQAEHDQVLAELMRKRRLLNERLEYFDKLNRRLANLTKFLDIENERFNTALEELNRNRSEILKRTDITEEEREKLLMQSEAEIENLKHEHNSHIMESYKHLSDLAFEVPEKERQYKEQFLSARQIDELREFEEKKFRQKRMTKEERLALLRMGLQITPSGRIITQDGIITLDEARRLGLLNYLYYGYYDEGEEEEEEVELEYSIKSEEKITEKGTLYPSSSRTSTEVSSTLSSSEHHLTSQDVEYLKRVFGKSLTLALAEITAVQPSDPIHYLAHWLIKYRYNQEIDEVKRIELQALMIERERLEAERLHNELTDEARLAMYEVLFRTENYILQREYELRRLAMEADGEEFVGDDDDYDADIRDMIQSIFK